jgi:hypothetical protein
MLIRHSIGRSIRPDNASAARVRAAPVEAGDGMRLKSGGAVMTAERVDQGGRAFIALDALDLVTAEAFTSTECPEARMAGGNHHHHNNNKLR